MSILRNQNTPHPSPDRIRRSQNWTSRVQLRVNTSFRYGYSTLFHHFVYCRTINVTHLNTFAIISIFIPFHPILYYPTHPTLSSCIFHSTTLCYPLVFYVILLYPIPSFCILFYPLLFYPLVSHACILSYPLLFLLIWPYSVLSHPIPLCYTIHSDPLQSVHLVKLINTDNSAVSKNHGTSFKSLVTCENKFQMKCDEYVLQSPLVQPTCPLRNKVNPYENINSKSDIAYILYTDLCRGLLWQQLWDPRQMNHDLSSRWLVVPSVGHNVTFETSRSMDHRLRGCLCPLWKI